MDLFLMNRYWSEDSKDQPEQTNEDKLLEKLKAKVASKKKSKSFADISITEETVSKKLKVDSNVNVVDKQESAKKKKNERKKQPGAEVPEPETGTTLKPNESTQFDTRAQTETDER